MLLHRAIGAGLVDALVSRAGDSPQPGKTLRVIVDTAARVLTHEPDDFHIGALHAAGNEAIDQAMVGVGQEVVAHADVEEGHTAIVVGKLPHEGRKWPAVLTAADRTIGECRAQAGGGLLAGPRVATPVVE